MYSTAALPCSEGWMRRAGRCINKCRLVVLLPVIASFVFCSAERQWLTRLKLLQQYHSMPTTRVNPFLLHSMAS